MNFVDSHCHLNHAYGGKTAADLVREAKLVGVTRLMTIAAEVSAFPVVQSFSEQFEEVHHTVGVHPHEAAAFRQSDLALIERFASHPKCRGIGEIGLDYYYQHSDRDTQKRALVFQLELAARLKLPVAIHSRDAEEDILPLLEDYAKSCAAGAIPGVIHCFTGTQRFGEACLGLGFYISFSGILTFKNSDPLRECAKAFPLEKLLVETDAPYLAPLPHRGKKCEPYMVTLTAQKLAEVRGIAVAEVAQATTENACRLFDI